MDQSKKMVKGNHDGQFFYLDRWVDKAHFRAFVYNEKGEEKLANNYPEYESLTTSGVWFASKPDASIKPRKQKNVALSDS